MSINTDLLITSPTFQEALVDKDGTPMSNGTVTCYQDTSRTTLKNWYYQAGSPPNYIYIPLPNPLKLSAAGSVCDINGVDTMPFFYPFSEQDQTEKQPYYITIVNEAETNQITRQNFPFNPNGGGGQTEVNLNNYIINGVFWRNIGTKDLTNETFATLAPSQHDGFSMPDFTFIKNNTGMPSTDTVTFQKFALMSQQILTGDITPEYYVNHTTSNAQSGETQKCYQFPISLHVNTLASVPYTVTIQAQNVGSVGAGANVLSFFIYQFTGTGTASPDPTLIQQGQVTLSPNWEKYFLTDIFPATNGLTLGNGGDDALYLQIQVPLNMDCSINFTKPCIYLTDDQETIPINDFQTYDQIDAVVNSARTGDVRTSLNQFYPFGWLPLNNGTIGNATSNATALADTQSWQLYNLLWTLFSPYTVSTTNILAQMVTSAGSNVAYGASAIEDFNANNAITLTQTMGKVILGTVPVPQLLPAYKTTFTASSSTGLLLTFANNVSLFNGMPIYVSNTGGALPTNLAADTIYYVTQFNGTNACHLATTFANAMASSVIAFGGAGTGTQTLVSAFNGTFEGEYAHTQLLAELATHTHAAGSPGTQFWVNSSTVGLAQSGTGLNGQGVDNTAPTGNSTPFNVTQPGVFFNMFIKL